MEVSGENAPDDVERDVGSSMSKVCLIVDGRPADVELDLKKDSSHHTESQELRTSLPTFPSLIGLNGTPLRVKLLCRFRRCVVSSLVTGFHSDCRRFIVVCGLSS